MAVRPQGKRYSDLDAASPPEYPDLFAITQKHPATGELETRRLTFGAMVAKIGSLGGSPVTSVNGYQGQVMLAVGDIPGVTSLVDEKCAQLAQDILDEVSNPTDIVDGGNF